MKLRRMNSGDVSRWMQTGKGAAQMICNISTASIVRVEARETVAL